VAKTKAQVDKQKRAADKRKKLEKTILRLAAELPEEEAPKGSASAPARHGAPGPDKDRPDS